MLSPKQVISNQKKIEKLNSAISERSHYHFLRSDPTRLRIMHLLNEQKSLCPSDLAQILAISISAVSHQLRMMEQSGLVKKEKKGKEINYSVNDEREKEKKFKLFS